MPRLGEERERPAELVEQAGGYCAPVSLALRSYRERGEAAWLRDHARWTPCHGAGRALTSWRYPPGAVRRAAPGPSWRHPPRATGAEQAPSAARATGRSWRHPPGAVSRTRAGAVRRAPPDRAGAISLELSAARSAAGPDSSNSARVPHVQAPSLARCCARPSARLGPGARGGQLQLGPRERGTFPGESAAHSWASAARPSGVNRRRLSGGSRTPGRCRACLSAPTRPGARIAAPGSARGAPGRQPSPRPAREALRPSRTAQIAGASNRARRNERLCILVAWIFPYRPYLKHLRRSHPCLPSPRSSIVGTRCCRVATRRRLPGANC
ncbi:hypothetical protein SAMN05444354_1409 [Stigmatella aurantiaca]|uniref:Uncharacterized protein n=1 Tax=Stigmatella aurantiaca TaxID=41 RepID=A0A1H8FVC2_STIAU|nr:hypothetical protein SAMN05444354_1409 [Stigmatella aurantiaca]